MAHPRVYHPSPSAGRISLSPAESHHLRTVLRCRLGEQVTVFDGCGGEADGVVREIARDGVVIEASELRRLPHPPTVRLTLAVALPRAPRQTFLFEKCTELGVWAIWPTLYERSVVKPRAGQLDKWRRVCIEAAKQCGSAWLPRIEEPVPFEETVAGADQFHTALVADRDGAAESIAACLLRVPAGAHALIWIGPEGGLTADELGSAARVGAVRARLARYILRIETAAIAAAALACVKEA